MLKAKKYTCDRCKQVVGFRDPVPIPQPEPVMTPEPWGGWKKMKRVGKFLVMPFLRLLALAACVVIPMLAIVLWPLTFVWAPLSFILFGRVHVREGEVNDFEGPLCNIWYLIHITDGFRFYKWVTEDD